MQIDLDGKPLNLTLGSLTLTCRPCTTALMYAAVAAARDRLQAEQAAGELPDEPAEREGRFRALQAAELAHRAVTTWEGARDRHGKPLACVPDTVAAAMERHFGLADRFLALYSAREDRWMSEGNASGPAPSGTGAAGPTTAKPATSSEAPAPEETIAEEAAQESLVTRSRKAKRAAAAPTASSDP